MDKLLSFTPEPFPELDREADYDELDPLASGQEAEETEQEVRGRRRPRPSPKAPRRYGKKPTLRPGLQGWVAGPRVTPLRQPPKLFPMPLSFPVLRPFPIPFVPPPEGMRPHQKPPAPWDIRRPDESRHPEQAGPEGSGSLPTAQPSEEPPSEHVRWVQNCLNRALGLSLPVDGLMSRETRSAVRLFQERRGLPVTGLIGPDTEAALQGTCAYVIAPRNIKEQQLETDWEMTHPASCTCPLCTEAATMNYQLSFEAVPFAENGDILELETLDLETLDPWQGESGADSPQQVRWIQESLNKIMGLQLKVDGIMGSRTRSAIRSFQQKQKLLADGLVGPATIKALINAGATSPTGIIAPDVIVPAEKRLEGFDFDKSNLKPSHFADIEIIANRIVESWRTGKPIFTVKVVGHTDPEGPPQHNQALGLRRSLAVRSALQNALKKKHKDLYYKVLVLASSKGEYEPIDLTNTNEGQVRNRRVDIFLSTKALLPLPSPPPPKPEPIKPVLPIWPDIDFPHPMPPEPPLCDLPAYERKKNNAIIKH